MKFVLLIILSTSIFAFENSEILSFLKQKELELDRKKLQEETSKLSTDWVEKIMGSYSDIKNSDISPNQNTKTYRISINQPIFKSGGIYYGIKYADAVKKVGTLELVKKENELIKGAISLLFNIQKMDLQIEKQRFLIENAKIDVMRKREQFEAGLLDGSSLDSAILDKNSAQLAMLESKKQKEDLLESFKNLSDKNPQNIELPRFEILEVDDFLDNNIEILHKKEEIAQKRYKRNGIATTYLPTLSINGEYINQDIENSFSGIKDHKNEYSTFGFVVSMPLFDINIKNNIQINHIEYLQASLGLRQKNEEQKNLYENTIKQLEILDKKRAISEDDLKQYDKLLKDSKERLEAGESTIYDVEVMENSKNIKQRELEIYKIEKELKLLELYANLQR